MKSLTRKISIIMLFSLASFTMQATNDSTEGNLPEPEATNNVVPEEGSQNEFSLEEILAVNEEEKNNPDCNETLLDQYLNKIYTNNKENFLKEKLIYEPTNKNTLLGTLTKFGAAGVIPIATMLCIALNANSDHYKNKTWFYSIKDTFKDVFKGSFNIYPFIGIPIIGYVVYRLVNYFISQPINYAMNRNAAFTNFIENWEDYKQLTPESLHEFFNAAHAEYQVNSNPKAFIKQIAPKALKKIKRAALEDNSILTSPAVKNLIIISLLGIAGVTISASLSTIQDTIKDL